MTDKIKSILAEFAKQFQQPFTACKILVPDMNDALWSLEYREEVMQHLLVDGGNLIWYEMPLNNRIWTSEWLTIHPTANRYGFPLKSWRWFPDKHLDKSYLLEFHPQYDCAEIQAWLDSKMEAQP